MRNLIVFSFLLLLVGCASSDLSSLEVRSEMSPMAQGELQIQIQSPTGELTTVDGATNIEVEGVASTIGGVRYLDMILVMDTSMSLLKTDPDDYRSAGAIGLVRNLSPKSDTKIGVVTFDNDGEVAQPMTSDRDKVVKSLRELSRSGKTDLAAGIRAALAELDANGRPESSRVIMLFTDGKSNRKKALAASQEAKLQGVTVQTLLLGSNRNGAQILDEIAWSTGGSFVQVTDPTMLPEAFLNLRTTGVDSVMLSVNGSEPVRTKLTGGTFSGNVPLDVGENRIVATATSLDDRTRESIITVNVLDASCAALEVTAMNEGEPALSLNDRAVEIVVDASRSMWGRMQGQPKMVVAKEILQDVSDWLPADTDLALRAYGSASPSDDNNCADSTLLVPFGAETRDPVRAAIDGLRPLGQTPIAYALQQAAADFQTGDKDRSLVLVTDGIESCGGDPVAAARQLREQGIMVHLIGFGLGNAADEDSASLQAVADASGGRYITAGSAEELKEALALTVGTPYRVYKGDVEIASSSLGSTEPLLLPGGDYRVALDSSPPNEVNVRLEPRDQLTLTLEKQAGAVSHFEKRNDLPYTSCEAAIASIERLEAEAADNPVQTATY
ncbi:MAG: VWA domain-containing protein [Gammaproteobacteria bacterium]|nr:VWA domain-containing protein [Gammaproteobacteria bacterium]